MGRLNLEHIMTQSEHNQLAELLCLIVRLLVILEGSNVVHPERATYSHRTLRLGVRAIVRKWLSTNTEVGHPVL